jgi:hypothetical protein
MIDAAELSIQRFIFFPFRVPAPIYSLFGKIYLLNFSACGKLVLSIAWREHHALTLQRFGNWCRANPDFLWSLVVPSN